MSCLGCGPHGSNPEICRRARMGRRPILLALLFTAIEVVGFVCLALVSQADASRSLRTFAGLLLPQLGSMFACVATTWYVVFTYYILKATDDARRHAWEPFVALRWSTGKSPEALTFPEMAD